MPPRAMKVPATDRAAEARKTQPTRPALLATGVSSAMPSSATCLSASSAALNDVLRNVTAAWGGREPAEGQRGAVEEPH